MQEKIKKHEMIEKAKLEQIKKREEEFEKKRQKIEQLNRERELQEPIQI